MKFKDFLNELILAKDKRMELRDIIINALTPALKLNKALKKGKGDVVLNRRDAQSLMDGINRVTKYLDKIEIEK
jgi:hypothetical protein